MITWRSRATRDCLFNAVENKSDIIVYDLETTGLSATNDRVIQFSAVKIRANDDGIFEEIGSLSSYINPLIPIPPKITEITGITDDTVANAPSEKEFFDTIKDFFGETYIASGYNIVKFDNRFMKEMFARYGAEFNPTENLDVLEIARDNIEKKDTTDFKLGTIVSSYGVGDDLTFHNAIDDVIATSRLLKVFYREYKDSFEKDEGHAIDETVPDMNKKQVEKIYGLKFWEGYRGFSRIYISTNLGQFFYDIRKHLWNVNKDNPYSVDDVDMETLKKKTLEFANVPNEYELSKFR